MKTFEEREQRISELAVMHTVGDLDENHVHELMTIIVELQKAGESQLAVIGMQQSQLAEARETNDRLVKLISRHLAITFPSMSEEEIVACVQETLDKDAALEARNER